MRAILPSIVPYCPVKRVCRHPRDGYNPKGFLAHPYREHVAMPNISPPRKGGRTISEDFVDSTPAREVSVVHSSFGRLRVHLTHWSGARSEDIVAYLRRLPGVTRAAASPLTGNALLLFEPRQTNAHTLMEALPAMRLDSPPDQPGLPAQRDDSPPQNLKPPRPAHIYMTGAGRVLYKILGWSSVGMAVVGAIMPGIPTAPFVVLAGYFFIRSSPEAHQWLRQSRWFGPILRDWEDHRGVRPSIRNAAAALIVVGMVLTSLMGLPTALLASIITMQVIGLAIVLSLPVVEPSAPALLAGAE
jgi:uncharacterized membrane protein YbaN (DUF454 family)